MIVRPINSFMYKLIDYAGLYPPSELPIGKAFPNYLKYISGDRRDALSSFIISAHRLDQLEGMLTNLAHKVNLSVIVGGGNSATSFRQKIGDDLQKIELIEAYDKVEVHSLETKFPVEIFLQGETAVLALLNDVAEKIRRTKLKRVKIFYELPILDIGMEKYLINFIGAVGIHSDNAFPENYLGCSLKIRTGGVTPELFPAPSVLSRVIQLCTTYNLPFKATAGLHHPFRHYDAKLGVHRHGFVNLFLGAMLAKRYSLSRQLILEIISDQQEANFTFTEDHIAWKNYKVTTAEIDDLRKSFCISYGSCDFMEPIDHLVKRNIL